MFRRANMEDPTVKTYNNSSFYVGVVMWIKMCVVIVTGGFTVDFDF